MQFLITNNGTHPPDKWAELTVANILGFIQISEDATDDGEALQQRSIARRAKANLHPILFNILEEEFDKAQKAERGELKREGVKRLGQHIHIAPAADKVLERLAVAFAATPFKGHFEKPEVIDVLRRMVSQYLGNVTHIERSVHADKNPDAKEAKAFRAKQRGE